ncbi:hypothetical protein DTO212C5_8941 [Paecilomyces variotii]|nr:hypothetical protein DTO212C5_8941 [Paecilomyces variotii]
MGLHSKQLIYMLSPPHGKITPQDHGGYIVIMTWIMMSLMSLTVLARLLTRIIPITIYGWDDVAIGLGMVVAIIQSVVVHWAVNNGMGRHYSALNSHEFTLYSKYNYAAQILFTIALCFAKLSVLLFISRLTPSIEMKRVSRVAAGIVTAWGMSFATALALQCKGPAHWDFSQEENCVDRSSLYCLFGTLDIITEVAIMSLPAFIVWNVQITRRQRWTVIGVFCSRLFVCVSTAFTLSTLRPYREAGDQTWNEVTPQIWIQTTQALSLTTACIPCLRPFLASLESGFIDSTMRSHINKTYGSSSGSAAKGSASGGSRSNGSNPTSEEGIELKAIGRRTETSRVAILTPDNNLFTSRMASTSIQTDARKAKAALSGLQKRAESNFDDGLPFRVGDRTIRKISNHRYQIPPRPLGSSGGESTRPLNDSTEMVLFTDDESSTEADHRGRQPFESNRGNNIRRARDSLDSYRGEKLSYT